MSESETAVPRPLPLAVKISKRGLRFPDLMDQAVVDELASRGYEILPAFRLRRRGNFEIDLRLAAGQKLDLVGDLLVHTWFLASPPILPKLRFVPDENAPNRCRISWSEDASFDPAARVRRHRYVELHHREEGPRIPLPVIFKPLPKNTEPLPGRCTPDTSTEVEEAPIAELKISFREIDGEVRPWFDIFDQSLFPPGVEPEPILLGEERGFALELELLEGRFVISGPSVPRIRWFDEEGEVPGPPDHVTGVELVSDNRLRVSWRNPDDETVSSFDVLCEHRGRAIWLDPTIYTKGIGTV